MAIDLRYGDCLEVMRGMADASVTAIVTDPPYALGFMGKGWDKVLPPVDVWREALRVLKPGGVALVFGGTRTFHRLTCSLEDAGFEIRDVICWLYGSGFPKSLAIDKAIDRQRYDREEVLEVTRWINSATKSAGVTYQKILEEFGFNKGSGQVGHWTATTPGSQPAVPTIEQVPKLLEVLGNPEVPERISRLLLDLNGKKGQPGPDWFRRAVVGTKTVPDARVTRPHFAAMCGDGTASREVDVTTPATERSAPWHGYGTALKPAWEPIILAMKPTDGTFAANALAHGVAGINVDACRVGTDGGGTVCTNRDESGHCMGHRNAGRSTAGETFHGPNTTGVGRWPANVAHDGNDEATSGMGDAARYFYCGKATQKDRGDGNNHPTVKPTALMRWLVRMVKMPSGTVVLDPFMGSGSTGVACKAEGVDFIGIERESEYLEIARRRTAE